MPSDATFNFALSIIISILIGLVVTMNMYRIFRNQNKNKSSVIHSEFTKNISKEKDKKKNGHYIYLSSILSIISTGCLSCSSSLGLWIFTFLTGIIGTTASTTVVSFLSEYQIALRMLSLGLVIWAFLSINNEINNNYYCKITNNHNNNSNIMRKEKENNLN